MAHFYRQSDARFEPTDLAKSPWERGKQNGVALGGLLAYLIDAMPAAQPMNTARLQIDILSAAPFASTEGRCVVIRDGKRIQLVESQLLVDNRLVARATALRVRAAETPSLSVSSPYPAPEDVPSAAFMGPGAFGGTLETRIIQGGLRESGPGTLWARFGHEHVEGVALTPLVRAATLGDFGGGLSSVLPVEQWSFANLDIALSLAREPEGDWLLMDAETATAGNGVAIASATLADRRGPFGRSSQTLFIAPRS